MWSHFIAGVGNPDPHLWSPGLIKCGNNNLCIRRRWLCDGDNDCGDNSDEELTFCASRECERQDFRCATTHRCIPSDWVCDDDNDCGDASDEPPDCSKSSNDVAVMVSRALRCFSI